MSERKISEQGEWVHSSPDVLAQRIKPRDAPGFFTKTIVVKEFERLLILEKGMIIQILRQGPHQLGGILVRDREAIFLDCSDKDLPYGYRFPLRDGTSVGCNGDIRFVINDVGHFYATILGSVIGSKDVMAIIDLKKRIDSELENVLAPLFIGYTMPRLYYNRGKEREDVYNRIIVEMRRTLVRWGLEFIEGGLTIRYLFPEKWMKAQEERAERVVEEAAKTVICPNCETLVPPSTTKCPKCGADVIR